MLQWPAFSVTSFKLVRRLAGLGIAPATVLDVGANVGQFATACAHAFGSAAIHSFEPVDATVSALRRNVARLPQVTVHAMALGERAGETAMHVNAHSHASSLLPLGAAHRAAFPEAREVGSVRVPVTTLDALFPSGPASPILLKLDVQGFELPVLRGARHLLARVDWVLLEASFQPLYEGEASFEELWLFMREAGFRFDRPVGWLFSPRDGAMLQLDALFRRARPEPAGDSPRA